ncbi:cupin domain-containing protein [Protaetiibacter mangrovi]|uniref:Cupin domain-containing protein n=1 Tax=Protaetiibacter mangrovi TaxID=2970926 RepID=A0ABT1ZI31_9MICO|nr:cupin domain-containing protein [Protaetiibacter mangrovi]MCS0500366.1 cupin domain-containing protein [Protaetiibacter mangrovi]TPX02451.1 cupin domain-containing protein [Schumannella luteola]
MHIIEEAARFGSADGAADYRERLRSPGLSLGSYSIPAGAGDPQQPHTEDEVYICLQGRATLLGADARLSIRPGTVAFVAAGEEHRFVDVEEDLLVLVVFGPAENRNRVPA